MKNWWAMELAIASPSRFVLTPAALFASKRALVPALLVSEVKPAQSPKLTNLPFNSFATRKSQFTELIFLPPVKLIWEF